MVIKIRKINVIVILKHFEALKNEFLIKCSINIELQVSTAAHIGSGSQISGPTESAYLFDRLKKHC